MSHLFVSPKQYFEELVEEGFVKRQVKSPPAAKIYMVGLLEHYLDARNLSWEHRGEDGVSRPTTLAETFLLAQQTQDPERSIMLKRLADRSLYISGFFGDSLERKLVDIDYYAGVGGAAYESLAASVKEDSLAFTYQIFSKKFLEFVDVLTYISQKSLVKSDESILRLYERYLRTGSPLAREKLAEMGVVTIPLDQMKASRQD